MNRNIVTFLLIFVPGMSVASTRHIDCTQTTDSGVPQIVRVIIDDASDKAEVKSFATSADCAQNDSCATTIYRKEVLPSVIRLTSVLLVGSLSYTTTIDIDRTDLSLVTRTSLSTAVGTSDTTANGKCTMKVDSTEKIL